MDYTNANRLATALIEVLEDNAAGIPASSAGLAAEVAQYGTMEEANSVVSLLVTGGLFARKGDVLVKGARFDAIAGQLAAFKAKS